MLELWLTFYLILVVGALIGLGLAFVVADLVQYVKDGWR